ncbi:MAG: ammonium transporter, partial [Snowella sp.]
MSKTTLNPTTASSLNNHSSNSIAFFSTVDERVSIWGAISRFVSPYWWACIPLTALIVVVWNGAVVAQEKEVVEITIDTVNTSVATLQGTLNTIWILIASILVIFMNAGFAMLEAGLCRQKNAVNILTKNLIVFALA